MKNRQRVVNQFLIVFAIITLAATAWAAVTTFKRGNSGFEKVTVKTADIRHYRRASTTTKGPDDYVASADINLATLYTKNVFKVNTTAGAVDLDFADDAALHADDIGSEWLFMVGIGGTNELTVTAGASGVTTVKTIALAGATCEDVGDTIRVVAYSTTQATVFTACAD